MLQLDFGVEIQGVTESWTRTISRQVQGWLMTLPFADTIIGDRACFYADCDSNGQTLKAEAMNGSLRHLMMMPTMLFEKDISNAQLLELLPVIYRYLPESELLPIGQSAEPAHYTALTLLNTAITPKHLSSHKITKSLKDYWGIIRKCCEFYVKAYVDDPVGTPFKTRARHHALYIGLLEVFSSSPDFAQILGSTSGFIPLMTRVWRFEMSWFHQPQPLSSAAVVLYQIIRTSRPFFSVFVASLGNMPSEVSRLCVERVIATGTRPIIPSSIMQADVAMVSCCAEDRAHRRCLLSEGSMAISALTHTMSQITSHTSSFDDPFIARSCLKLCLAYISPTLQDEGVGRVSQALEERILVSLFKTKPLPATVINNGKLSRPAQDDGINQVFAAILTTITPYLVYRSVLRRAIKSLKTIRSLGLERKMESVIPKYKSFWKAWQIFTDYAMDRVTCKATVSDYCRSLERPSRVCRNHMVISARASGHKYSN